MEPLNSTYSKINDGNDANDDSPIRCVTDVIAAAEPAPASSLASDAGAAETKAPAAATQEGDFPQAYPDAPDGPPAADPAAEASGNGSHGSPAEADGVPTAGPWGDDEGDPLADEDAAEIKAPWKQGARLGRASVPQHDANASFSTGARGCKLANRRS